MKRLFGLHRARYFGVAKTHAQMVMAAILQTLLKAAHKNTYQQIGLVPLTFRSPNSFMRPFVQMPRGFYHLATSACALDYKIR